MKLQFSAKIITLSAIYQASYQLSYRITQSGETFDVIIAIARGGFPVARLVCDFLNIRQLSAMRVSHYGAGASQHSKAAIIEPVQIDVKGKCVLLVDDVNDTGDSLCLATKHICSLQPALLKTAVLHEKPTTQFKADYVAKRQQRWRWLIYQWAVTEDVLSFLQKDNKLKYTDDEIHTHLMTKYQLKISKKLLKQVLSLKQNYYPKFGS